MTNSNDEFELTHDMLLEAQQQGQLLEETLTKILELIAKIRKNHATDQEMMMYCDVLEEQAIDLLVPSDSTISNTLQQLEQEFPIWHEDEEGF